MGGINSLPAPRCITCLCHFPHLRDNPIRGIPSCVLLGRQRIGAVQGCGEQRLQFSGGPRSTGVLRSDLHSEALPRLARQRPTHADQDAFASQELQWLFSGARLGELARLQVQDVMELESVPVLRLGDTGKGQKFKRKAGRRMIPIHTELLRLGFAEYVATVRQCGEVSLWPRLPLSRNKPSDYFGRWFLDHRRELGLAGAGEAADSEAAEDPTKPTDYPTFHYFRHTVRPLMRKAGISSTVQDRIPSLWTKVWR